MATTTPNYGWTVPTSTDLVKDGATAIETLGDAIDASMNTALGTKKAGMVLLSTVSFSAVASQSFNSVFSSTYDNYKIFVDISATSGGNVDMFFRLRASGSDTTSNYKSQRFFSNATSGNNSANYPDTTKWTAGIDGPVSGSNAVLDYSLYGPNIAGKTSLLSQGFTPYSSSQYLFLVGAQQTDATQFDGFTLFTASGTMTGKISIYGLAI